MANVVFGWQICNLLHVLFTSHPCLVCAGSALLALRPAAILDLFLDSKIILFKLQNMINKLQLIFKVS